MSRAVMQQALEAQGRMKLSRDYARLPGYPLSDADRQMAKSTAALREALAQPDPLFAVPVAAKKWAALQDEGYKMRQLCFERDGKTGTIDAWGKVLWQSEQSERTGWPAGMLQDDDRKLSKWLASKPDAKYLVDMAQPVQTVAVSGLACNHEWVRREQDQPWLECEKCGSDYASSATISQPVQPTKEDMPAICAALGFDPTNHHNAARCPYCTPSKSAQPVQPANQSMINKTREDFEIEARCRSMDVERFESGYSDCNTDYGWVFWQAALAQPEQKPVKFLAYGSRFKISYDKRQSSGKIDCIPAELGGRWVALVAAEDDCHLNLLSPPRRQEEQEPIAYLDPKGLAKLQNCNGMSIWAESHKIHADMPEVTALALTAVYTAPPAQELVAWGVDWGRNGDRSCVSIVKKHPGGHIEVVATENDPKPSHPPRHQPMRRATIEDARDYLNTNDKAMWAIGWNECVEAYSIKGAT